MDTRFNRIVQAGAIVSRHRLGDELHAQTATKCHQEAKGRAREKKKRRNLPAATACIIDTVGERWVWVRERERLTACESEDMEEAGERKGGLRVTKAGGSGVHRAQSAEVQVGGQWRDAAETRPGTPLV